MTGRFSIVCAIVVSTAAVSWAQRDGGAQGRLNAAIPSAQSAKYKFVVDAQDWENPYLVIQPDGIEIISSWLASGRRTVPIGELHATLVALPVAAWPYGRVVAAQDNGLRAADGSDDQPTRRNHEVASRILRQLRVRVEWRPS